MIRHNAPKIALSDPDRSAEALKAVAAANRHLEGETMRLFNELRDARR